MTEKDAIAEVKKLLWEPIKDKLRGEALSEIILTKERCIISDWAFEEIMERSLKGGTK